MRANDRCACYCDKPCTGFAGSQSPTVRRPPLSQRYGRQYMRRNPAAPRLDRAIPLCGGVARSDGVVTRIDYFFTRIGGTRGRDPYNFTVAFTRKNTLKCDNELVGDTTPCTRNHIASCFTRRNSSFFIRRACVPWSYHCVGTPFT
jgi:hypothetical protein